MINSRTTTVLLTEEKAEFLRVRRGKDDKVEFLRVRRGKDDNYSSSPPD
jgi:hypothetical protein